MVEARSYPRENTEEMGTPYMQLVNIFLRTVEARSYARKKFEYRAFAACNNWTAQPTTPFVAQKKKIGRKKKLS